MATEKRVMLGRRQIDVAQIEVNTETVQIMIETIEGREILVKVNGTDVNINIVSKGKNMTAMKTTETEKEMIRITIVDIHVKTRTDTTLGTPDR